MNSAGEFVKWCNFFFIHCDHGGIGPWQMNASVFCEVTPKSDNSKVKQAKVKQSVSNVNENDHNNVLIALNVGCVDAAAHFGSFITYYILISMKDCIGLIINLMQLERDARDF